MRWVCQSGGCRVAWRVLLAVVLVGPAMCSQAELVDRIVATVNRRVILASEWDEAVRFECLLNGRRLQDVTEDQRIATLQRLIDQELIEEQMRASSFVSAAPGEIAARVRELRQTVPAWKTDDGWRAALVAYGLSEEDVEERTAVQVNVLRYLDLRFRPQVHIDRRAMESYYREQLLPEMRGAGWSDVPFDQVAPKIEQVLIEQQINELQERWLSGLRLQGEIQVR